MNYYEHHIGDYDSATAHLSLLEDAVYRRLICLYYRTEAPLAADVKAVCRLVRATSKAERDTVADVLAEFFELRTDGWHNDRCDAEIARFLDAEPDRQAKRDNAAERQRRARERRAALFDALRGHDIVPAWDTPTKALEGLLSQAQARKDDAPVTQPVTPIVTPVTQPVTRDNTATHTHPPPPTSQYPGYLLLPSVGGGGSAPSATDPPTPPPPFDGLNADVLNGKAVVPLAAGFELPAQWGLDALALGFTDTEVLREAERMRQWATEGKGKGTRRSVKGWRQTWSNWLAKAAKEAR